MADTAAVENGQGRFPRLRTVRILVWVMAAVASVGLFGIVALMTLPGWVDQRYIWAVSLEASWGSLMTFVVAGAFASIARNPRRPWPGAALLAVAVLALLLGAALGADVRLLPLAAVIGVPAGVRLWLARKNVQPLSTATKLSRPYLVLALTSADKGGRQPFGGLYWCGNAGLPRPCRCHGRELVGCGDGAVGDADRPAGATV